MIQGEEYTQMKVLTASHSLLSPDQVEAVRIVDISQVVGLVVTRANAWASAPDHRHTASDPPDFQNKTVEDYVVCLRDGGDFNAQNLAKSILRRDRRYVLT